MAWRTAFVGREREIRRVRELLSGTQLLTLTGPGGTGKTRLAVEALAGEADSYPGGITIVELASVRDEGQVVPAIATALGVRDSGAVDLVHVLSERLGSAPALLLLDNLEHLADAAPAIGRLLDATPALRVVATSRVALTISGAQEYPVPPLELPDVPSGPARERTLDVQAIGAVESVALFVERARAVTPDFTLTQSNVGAVTQICRRLDGLPLAIELAAARVKVLAPEALLKRLEQGLQVLRGGAADGPARQLTLQSTIAWSYDLLPPNEAEVFRRCSVFVGGFEIDGAAAISSLREPTDDLLQALSLLVDHNLLTVSAAADGEPRFRMLETIREFGLGEVATAELAALRSRHARYSVELAEAAERQLRGSDHGRWLSRLTDELDNLRAALDWASEERALEELTRLAAALAPFWRYYGDIREGRRRLLEAVALSADASRSSQAKVLRGAGWLQAVSGNVVPGARLLIRSLRIYEELRDGQEAATTLYHLGATLRDAGRRAVARRCQERGLVLARELGVAATEARTLWALAELAGDSGRLEERRRLVAEAIDASRRAGDRQRLALITGEFGWVAWDDGNRETAIERWSEAIRLFRELGDRAFLASVLVVLGYGLLHAGRPEEARAPLVEGLEVSRDVGALPDLLTALAHAADWFAGIGQWEQALQHWSAANAIRQRTGIDAEQVFPLLQVATALGLRPSEGMGRSSPETAPITVERALDAAIRALEATPVPATVGARRPARSPDDLTPREREVLELVVAGHTNAEIGSALYISRKTASVHVANIKAKLGAGSRVEVATTALQRDLVRRVPKPAAVAR